MKKKKGNSITFILILVLLAGLSLLLYPSVSDYWNSFHQTQAIASYAENVATLEQASYDVLWEDAKAYKPPFWGGATPTFSAKRSGRNMRSCSTFPGLA